MLYSPKIPDSLLLSDNRLKNTIEQLNESQSKKAEKFYKVMLENASHKRMQSNPTMGRFLQRNLHAGNSK